MRKRLALAVISFAHVACVPITKQFDPQSHVRMGRELSSITVADFNGDKIPDLLASRAAGNGEVQVLIGRGNGTFHKLSPMGGAFAAPGRPAVADFDGDDIPDLAIANWVTGGFVSILLGNGDGTFQEPQQHIIGFTALSLKTGDFNSDGHVDLALANFSPERFDFHGLVGYMEGAVTILLGKGDGTFHPASTTAIGTGPAALCVGDWNGDQKEDLAVGDIKARRIYILLGRGDGSFRQGVAHTGSPSLLMTKDLDDDGRTDLIAGYYGGFEVLLSNGDGTFRTAGDYTTLPTQGMSLADFDGDGKIDVFSAKRFLRGDGTGKFTVAELPDMEYVDASVAAGDFDGDGWIDVVAADTEHSRLTLFRNVGGTKLARISR